MTADDAVVDHMDKDCCGDGSAAAASVDDVNAGAADDEDADDDKPLVAFQCGEGRKKTSHYRCECPCCGVYVDCDR